MTRYTMKELPVFERPYEKLELYGEKALSNAELLAIIIKSGTRDETSVQVAQRILNEFCAEGNSLSLRNVSLNKLTSIKGIGRVKAILLKAVFELANRIDVAVTEKPMLAHSSTAGEYFLNSLSNEKQERLKVIGLDVKGRLERDETVFIGELNSIHISARDVFRMPIESGCANIIIAHNHPSGDPTPSSEDILMTEKIKELGRLLEIELLDHIVVGKGAYISIRQQKLLKW